MKFPLLSGVLIQKKSYFRNKELFQILKVFIFIKRKPLKPMLTQLD